jgi:small redox-active disulfide protein 2
MKKIQILGTGCPKCQKLAANAEQAAKGLGIEYEIEKVTDIQKIMNSGVMMTPGLVVDGNIKSTGKVLSIEEIKKLLS